MDISNSADLVDVRDIIARFEELDADDERDLDDDQEHVELGSLLEELSGNGGDEQWRGDWYPVTLIRETYFTEYAQDLAEDCFEYTNDNSWPYSHIDWEAAAADLQQDYTSIEYAGVTYWYR